MRVLCFGGTFNPIHHGHLICARAIAEARGFDQVYLIPSAQPPHRQGQFDLASAQDRLTMCQLAVQETPFFDVSDVELRRTGPSYTLETARALRREGSDQVSWLIGTDTVSQLPSWHDPAALMREVKFVVMARPGWSFDWDSLEPPYRALRQNVVEGPMIAISATEVRRRVAAGLGIDFLVPPQVQRYILDRRLYGSPRGNA
jgi:nicotinate-nucleotide adenylyltransferase